MQKKDVRVTSKNTKLNEHFLDLEKELYANSRGTKTV